ncbi:MAG: intermembrane transport protein PqiB [Cellvibrionaceae bacterium]
MTDSELADNKPTEQMPPQKAESISPVWLVPIIALIIALSLAYKSWQDQGPVVEIYFNKAEGIEPKRTKIRYKNVDIGTVERVRVSDDLSSIIVIAELAQEFSSYLSENTKFWVVSPRISLSGVSGLSTLVSGVYIEIDPGQAGTSKFSFQGLDEPPRVRSDSLGGSYTLFAKELGSLDVGSPVYFKHIKVGQVTSYALSPGNQDIEISLFIEAPYDQLVTEHSRFWNVSGLEAGLDANGFHLELESLNAFIAGGVAFDSPYVSDSLETSTISTFFLLPNRKAVMDGAYVTSYPFAMNFINQSTRGLQPGSPVEYFGVQIGEVRKVAFASVTPEEAVTRVIIDIQPERMAHKQALEQKVFEENINGMIVGGLRAQLKSGSLLTGGLYIDLVATTDKNQALLRENNLAYIPTIPSDADDITKRIASIAAKIDQMPLANIGNDLSDSLSQLNGLLNELNNADFSKKVGSTVANIEKASTQFEAVTLSAMTSIQQLEQTLKTMEQSIAPDSQLYFELLNTLKSVNESAESVRQFTDELNRYPQSLILGK